jgi:hypothetical protein
MKVEIPYDGCSDKTFAMWAADYASETGFEYVDVTHFVLKKSS